ncbi:MAG: hypothetical protein GXP22_06830 [Gammaproteobacteria bacterium]|nr:hypothetical protein [Gammaproteobacteria bacterium]
MSEEIVKKWLNDVVKTAANRDHAAHVDLISQRVSLTGVPGFDAIGFQQWSEQCKHEFDNQLLKSVRYEGLKMVADTTSRIMFKTYEIVEGVDGTVNAQGVEVLLEKEDDDQWRVVQERILDEGETRHAGLMSG